MAKQPLHTHAPLSVGELAQRSGVAVSTLHFYESKGLISSQRSAGNQRRYGRDTLRKVAVIRIAQRVGVPLQTIGQALDRLPEGDARAVKALTLVVDENPAPVVGTFTFPTASCSCSNCATS